MVFTTRLVWPEPWQVWQVFSSVPFLAPAAALAPAPEEALEAPAPAENIAELREDVFHVGAAAVAAAHALMAVPVIARALISIAEHFISLCGLLEFVLGGRVVGVFIGVVLDGHLAVSRLDNVAFRRFGNA
jgi:hypothetical protein